MKRPQVAEPVAPVKGRPDWIVVVLALLGLGVAGYLTALKLGGNQAFLCRDGSGCDIVQASRYSLLAGVPTAMWGAGLYAAIAVLAAMPRTVRRWQSAFMLVSGAVAFSLYLTYLSIFVIGATCQYCLASGVIALALLVVMILRRPRGEGREAAAYRPGKLAALGITAGVFTVFIGAFIFAADFSTPAGYQAALAQHLAKSNSTFYGAFW
ncbi:MAG TPA: vitamin K epoxide reductase family protein [Terriglobales bacterium]|nr:vitamin K epoxide reductase family protein [Terriglobales bacterium]